MTARPLAAIGRPRPAHLEWAGAAAVAAVALGVASSLDTRAVIITAVVLGIALAAVLWGVSITDVLVAAIFLEVVSFGGVTISRVLAPIALVFVLMALIRGRVQFRGGPVLVPVAAYALWAFASGIWTVSMPHTLNFLGSLGIALVFMFAFATMVQGETDVRRTLHVLAFASMAIGLASIASFAGLPIAVTDSLQEGRVQGGVGDPNFFANVQLVALPLIIVLAAEAKTLLMRTLLGFAAFVTITSVFSTLSRGGLIALAVLAVALPFIPSRWLFANRRQKTAVLLVLALCVGALFTRPGFREEVVSRVQTLFVSSSIDPSGSSAGSGRTELWKAAFASVEERPLLGLGYGAYPSASNQLLFDTPGVNLELISNHPDGIEVHSAYLGTTVDLGFIGLAAFLGILSATFVMMARTAARARRVGALFLGRVATAMCLSMVGWAISSTFIETETARPLWILIGMTLALRKIVKDIERRLPTPTSFEWPFPASAAQAGGARS